MSELSRSTYPVRTRGGCQGGSNGPIVAVGKASIAVGEIDIDPVAPALFGNGAVAMLSVSGIVVDDGYAGTNKFASSGSRLSRHAIVSGADL